MVYENRELSWLKFNERVLEEAAREAVPLGERFNFLSIYLSNLDEFFKVRVGSLVDMMSVDPEKRENKTDMTTAEQIDAIIEAVRRLDARKEEIYKELTAKVKDYGVQLAGFNELSETEKRSATEYFDKNVALLLSPHIVGRLQPFPFIRDCEVHAVALLRKKNTVETGRRVKIGIVSCAVKALPQMIRVSGHKNRFILMEDLIANCLERVFRNYRIEEKTLVRLVRNADIDADSLYDEGLDYREFMSDLMKHRRQMEAVRMVISNPFNSEKLSEFCNEVEISPNSVFISRIPLDLTFMSGIKKLLKDRSELFYQRRSPQRPSDIVYNRPIMDQIKEKDKLLSYPYDSMQPFLHMLREAADDPDVIAIKISLYRVAKNSQVVEYLIDAAENGKDVLVLLELKARFDEENNIAWSERLEEAGCQVIYGLNGIKVHSKLCLIVRKGETGPEYISHIGTGNFNEVTARLYTDYALLTANQDIGEDIAALFQSLSMDETVQESDYLLVAPNYLRNPVIKMIREETERARSGKGGYIGIKINSLTDKDIMDELIEASCAGVEIDMIIRGICCLNPAITGKTENIRVISIVGRYLEHSRIYIFGKGEREKIYISSADFMTRNTQRRVEVASPVLDKDIKDKIRSMFETMLADNTQAWEKGADGKYTRVENNEKPLNSQDAFCKLAYENTGANSAKVRREPVSLNNDDTFAKQRKKERERHLFARLFGKL